MQVMRGVFHSNPAETPLSTNGHLYFSSAAPNVTFHFYTEPAGVEMRAYCRFRTYCNWFIYSGLGSLSLQKCQLFTKGHGECRVAGEPGMRHPPKDERDSFWELWGFVRKKEKK